MAAHEQCKPLDAQPIVDGKEVKLAVTSFVDDIAAKGVSKGHIPNMVMEASYKPHGALSVACSIGGIDHEEIGSHSHGWLDPDRATM